jgi:hypothetical protein
MANSGDDTPPRGFYESIAAHSASSVFCMVRRPELAVRFPPRTAHGLPESSYLRAERKA